MNLPEGLPKSTTGKVFSTKKANAYLGVRSFVLVNFTKVNKEIILIFDHITLL